MTSFLKVVAAVTVLAIALLCQQIISNSVQNQALKLDDAEINHIKYGLFSVDEWKKQLEVIVGDEIGNFDLSRSNEKEVKAQVEVQLGILIDKVIERIHKANEGSFGGRIKQGFINALLDVKQVKAGIPEYADAIMAELKKAKNERKLKKVVKKEVARYFDKSFDVEDHTDLDSVLKRAGTTDVPEAKRRIANQIYDKQDVVSTESWLMIALSIFLFVLIGARGAKLTRFDYITLLMTLILLLGTGIATPMIDMEAKIAQMKFVLMDHDILFTNQILYFQSKSIMDVFWLMIHQPDLPMKLVGLLVVTFSVVFPISKLISTGLYYFDFHGARKNRVVEFFVMKSGKWSMSDVLVVAIFMAYVGFNGILSSQLAKLGEMAQDIELLTTNGTSLQPGFYLFLSYVLLGMLLALMLERKHKAPVTNK